MDATVKIVLCGPESTGKSHLGKKLAEALEVPYVNEFARTYLEENGNRYDQEVLGIIWRGHLEHQERSIPKGAKSVLLDTDLLNFYIWYDERYKHIPSALASAMGEERQHRYLVCYPDIPWEADLLRENPHDRLRLFDRYIKTLEFLERPYEVVMETALSRYENAVNAFHKLVSLP
jgi:nicotinamide riboside kinase